MTDPLPEPQPEPAPTPEEPVVQAGQVAGLISGVVTACAGAIGLILAHSDIGTIATSVGGVVTAVIALVAFFAPAVAARSARRLVTPLSQPRTASGQPAALVPLEEYRELRRLRPPGPQIPGRPDHLAP